MGVDEENLEAIDVDVILEYCPTTILLLCLCVFSSHSFWTSSSLDVPAGVTQEEGHTHMHRISHPPSFCGACLNFSREKDSAIPFPRRL